MDEKPCSLLSRCQGFEVICYLCLQSWWTSNLKRKQGGTPKFGDRGSTVVKVLCYKSEGRCFDPSWCQWIFH